jgi:hypothetical protein
MIYHPFGAVKQEMKPIAETQRIKKEGTQVPNFSVHSLCDLRASAVRVLTVL